MKELLEKSIDNRLETLKNSFPECFDREGNLNIEKFQEIMNPKVKMFKENYGLNWLGKTYARRLASTPVRTVLQEDVVHNEKLENRDSENVYIKGDNLEVLKHLSSAYSEKIKMIYIDPPYNTQSGEFVYNDNRKITEEELEKLISEGIIEEDEKERILYWLDSKSSSHSAWLTFMFPRLYLARKLLREDGVIFISIDDNENAQLKLLCDEIFGEENFVGNLPTIMNLNGNYDSFGFVETHEYTLVYTKNKNICEFGHLSTTAEEREEWSKDEYGFFKKADTLRRTGQDASREKRPKGWFPVFINKKNSIYVTEDDLPLNKDDIILYPVNDKGEELSWTWSKRKIMSEPQNLIVTETKKGKNIYKKQRPAFGNVPTKKPKSLLWKSEYSTSTATVNLEKLFDKKLFNGSKPISLIQDFFKIANTEDSLILDFFSGSATTAHAVMQLNAEDGGARKYIMVQIEEELEEKSEAYRFCTEKNLPTNVTSIGIERIKRASEKIKSETKAEIDYGFKIYSTKDVPNSLLIEESFNPQTIELFQMKKMTEEDRNSLLTTYKVYDGYLLTSKIENISLGGYTAYKVENTLYMLDTINSSDTQKILLEKIDNDREFTLDKIVIYGYEQTEGRYRREFMDNLNSYTNRKNAKIDIEVRY